MSDKVNVLRWRCRVLPRLGTLAMLAATLLIGSGPTVAAEATAAKSSEPAVVGRAIVTPAGPAEATAVTAAAPVATAASKGSNTYAVHAEPLDVNVDLPGVVEARDLTEVSVVPEQWNDLTVVEAVRHGARVQRGAVLVKLDTRKIDQAIGDLEVEEKVGQLALAQAREALALLKKSVPLQLAEVQRASQQSVEDLRDFVERGRPRTQQEFAFQVKQREQGLSYEQEELRQLEKMYKADDVVEATEEIVLKRARNEVEAAQFRLDQAREQRKWQLTFGLPRQEKTLRQDVAHTALAQERARATLPVSVTEQELSLKKLEYERAKSQKKLAQLRRDREKLSVRAPQGGLVYYGQSTRGTWPSVDNVGPALAVGAQIRPSQVFLTIVDPMSLRVRATVEESALHELRSGLRGTFRPTLDPIRKIPATLVNLSAVPIAPGKFDAEVEIEQREQGNPLPVALAPGMGGKVQFTVYSNPKALMVPAAAVHDADDQQPYVTVQGRDGKPQHRDVKLGRKVKDRVEILSGLAPDDKVVLKDESKK